MDAEQKRRLQHSKDKVAQEAKGKMGTGCPRCRTGKPDQDSHGSGVHCSGCIADALDLFVQVDRKETEIGRVYVEAAAEKILTVIREERHPNEGNFTMWDGSVHMISGTKATGELEPCPMHQASGRACGPHHKGYMSLPENQHPGRTSKAWCPCCQGRCAECNPEAGYGREGDLSTPPFTGSEDSYEETKITRVKEPTQTRCLKSPPAAGSDGRGWHQCTCQACKNSLATEGHEKSCGCHVCRPHDGSCKCAACANNRYRDRDRDKDDKDKGDKGAGNTTGTTEPIAEKKPPTEERKGRWKRKSSVAGSSKDKLAAQSKHPMGRMMKKLKRAKGPKKPKQAKGQRVVWDSKRCAREGVQYNAYTEFPKGHEGYIYPKDTTDSMSEGEGNIHKDRNKIISKIRKGGRQQRNAGYTEIAWLEYVAWVSRTQKAMTSQREPRDPGKERVITPEEDQEGTVFVGEVYKQEHRYIFVRCKACHIPMSKSTTDAIIGDPLISEVKSVCGQCKTARLVIRETLKANKKESMSLSQEITTESEGSTGEWLDTGAEP